MKNVYQVYVVADSDDIRDSLGIPHERADELKQKLDELDRTSNDVSDLLSGISKECTNAQELALACLLVGRYYSETPLQRSKNHEMMEAMKKAELKEIEIDPNDPASAAKKVEDLIKALIAKSRRGDKEE